MHSRAVAGKKFAAVGVEGHIFLIADNGLGAFIYSPGCHAEESLFRIIGAADHESQHFAYFAAFNRLGGGYGKTSA